MERVTAAPVVRNVVWQRCVGRLCGFILRCVERCVVEALMAAPRPRLMTELLYFMKYFSAPSPMSLSLSFSLFFTLSLSFSIFLSLSVSFSLSFSVFLYVSVSSGGPAAMI